MKTFQLYKRTADGRVVTKAGAAGWRDDAPFYCRFEFRGRAYRRALDTADRELAQQYAASKYKAIVDSVVRAELEGTALPVTPRVAALETYLTKYEATATGESSPLTRKHNVQALRRILAAAVPAVTRLDDLARAFDAYRAAANAKVEAAGSDQLRAITIKRTHNSTVRQARSVFCDAVALPIAKQLPGTPDFLPLLRATKALYFRDAKKTAEQYHPPSQGVIDATLAGWLKLPRDPFLAVGLALCASARKGEIEQAHWHWFTERDGNAWLDAGATVKDGTGRFRTRCLEPFFSVMMVRARAERWVDGGPLIVGSHVSAYCFSRRVSEWMKGLGWQTKKHLHALRAYAGSLVAMRYGFGIAREFCRHADERTTRDHYGWLVNPWRDAAPETLEVLAQPVQWARSQTAFVPHVLPAVGE